jgi:hypothetical protein
MCALVVLLGASAVVPGGRQGLQQGPAAAVALVGALGVLLGSCLLAGYAGTRGPAERAVMPLVEHDPDRQPSGVPGPLREPAGSRTPGG